MTADQLNLLDATTREPDRLRAEGGGLLGLVLDQAEFLYFLSSEWVEPSSGHLVLGVRQPCGSRAACSTDVAIWFSTQLLSDQQVMVWRNGTWLDIGLEDLLPEDEFVSWHGPMPAFAVDHFCVNSEAVKAKLLALAHSFVDMEVPIQPFNVCVFSQSAPPGEVPSMKSCPPPGTGTRCEVLRRWPHLLSRRLIRGLNCSATWSMWAAHDPSPLKNWGYLGGKLRFGLAGKSKVNFLRCGAPLSRGLETPSG